MLGKLHNYLIVLVVLTIVFITAGDLFLPNPSKSYSRNTRTNINKYFVSLISKPTPKEFQRPSGQREAQTEEFERNAEHGSPTKP